MTMLRATTLSLFLSAAAAARAAPAPEGNAIVDYVMGLVNDVISAGLAAGTDAADLVMGTPRFAVDVLMFLVNFVRWLPGLAVSIFNGDAATLDDLAAFASSAACTVFATYAALAAFNLFISTSVQVKDYFKGYMKIPTAVGGKKLPPPVVSIVQILQNQIDTYVVNVEKTFKIDKWFVPLGGQSGKATASAVASSMAAATSACMLLSVAPSVLALMRGGANKAAAEAIAYTVGTALGIQYLNKLAGN